MTWDWDKLQQQQKKNRGPEKGPSGESPNIEEILGKLKGLQFKGGPVIVLVLLLLAFFGMTMFYTVGVGEVGIVQRFGKHVKTTMPGLHLKLPNGIEKVTNVNVKRIYKEEFGFRAVRTKNARYSSDSENVNESLMLTGDLNVALVPWIIQYKIKDPYNFLFKVNNVFKVLRNFSEASMRIVVGDRSISEVISKRQEIADESKIYLQKALDKIGAGIRIVNIEMKKTNPPEPVQPSFNEVNQAVQEKEKMIYQAKEDYNKAIPAAKGEADRTIKSAQGYALEKLNRAKGDASRFISLFNEYRKAKNVTRRRLYLDALNEVLPKFDKKFIVDSDQKNVLPLLNLGTNGVK